MESLHVPASRRGLGDFNREEWPDFTLGFIVGYRPFFPEGVARVPLSLWGLRARFLRSYKRSCSRGLCRRSRLLNFAWQALSFCAVCERKSVLRKCQATPFHKIVKKACQARMFYKGAK